MVNISSPLPAMTKQMSSKQTSPTQEHTFRFLHQSCVCEGFVCVL